MQLLAEAEEGNTVPEVGTVPGEDTVLGEDTVPGEDIARGVGTGREVGIGQQVVGTGEVAHLDLWIIKTTQRWVLNCRHDLEHGTLTPEI